MNRTYASGLGLTALGLVGYLIGIETPYPGRAFSITGVMVGITLLAIANAAGVEEVR
ncbi:MULTISPECIES: hypothetical protein [unclassified Haladaptatus]|uniref:hypothetical protein n=1 Tax=unclassified Haladaptatus TaxID=2622732 RepID=UPI00209BEC4D|nr:MULTISPECIES: hypothetical protein [unclassified Haladaptatus]MCO8245091.1 hypothetical protein [Haladaptatus sp. AB643]MCO8253233.1 hypothetical protein [Haladaptatus sp. AB618]